MSRSLNNSPAEIIQQLLVDLALGSDSELNTLRAWPVYSTNEPSSPDNVITVTDTVGTDHGRSMVDGEAMGHYGFQIRIRAKDPRVGWKKADEIRTTFSEHVYNRTVSIDDEDTTDSYTVQALVGIGDVIPLGKEIGTSKRNLFTLNALLVVEQVVTS
jgi:hypothetical protein